MSKGMAVWERMPGLKNGVTGHHSLILHIFVEHLGQALF